MMRFPEKNSRGEAILLAFFAEARAMTIWQGAEVHGEFVTEKNPEGVDHAKMVQLYCDLVDRGCLMQEGIMYRLSLQARHFMEKRDQADLPPQKVPPRSINYLEKRIFAGYSPRSPWHMAL